MDSVVEKLVDLQNISVNRLKTGAVGQTYTKIEQIENNEDSPLFLSLNGTWKFKLSQSAFERELDFYKRDFDTSLWKDMVVPSVWQLEGYGKEDKPIFLKSDYPKAIDKNIIPKIDDKANAVGQYKRTFEVPKAWQDREIVICFEGVKSAFFIWVNNVKIGFSQGNMTPVEFNITEYVDFDEINTLSVEVYRYSAATYLDNNSTWYLSGIFRGVQLHSRAKISISDYYARCNFDEKYEDASLKIDVEVVNDTDQKRGMKALVYFGEEIEQAKNNMIMDGRLVVNANGITKITLEKTIHKPKKWSHESPELYTLLIVLMDEYKQVIEIKKLNYGFREIEIVDSRLLINGQPLVLKGVNRQDFDDKKGCAVSRETYEEDIRILKRLNVNAVRTSYNPSATYFYQLCDKYGIYVLDEVDVSCGGIKNIKMISDDEKWEKILVDKMTRMVDRDKNHPSVIIWSLGNQAGYGCNIEAMKRAAYTIDHSRPFHYEEDEELKVSDFLSKRYGSTEFIDKIGNYEDIKHKSIGRLFKDRPRTYLSYLYKDKPAMFCEFAYAGGNGLGNLKGFVDGFNKYDNWCGGFIWSFADTTINGEFSDTYLCASGIVAGDRKYHPAAYEVQKIYQSFEIKPVDLKNNQIEIFNKNVFEDFSKYYIQVEVLEDGEVLKAYVVDKCEIKPQNSLVIDLPIEEINLIKGAVYHININIKLRESNLFESKDFTVAWEQFQLPYEIAPKERQEVTKEAVVYDRKIRVEIAGDGFEVRISKLTGDITSLNYEGKEYLLSPLKLNFFRAATDLDLRKGSKEGKNAINTSWKKASSDYKVEKVTIDNFRTEIIINVYRKVKGIKDTVVTEYMIDGNGNVYVTNTITPKKDLVRFGTTMDISIEYDEISWFGKGIHETYQDRMQGAKIGVYSCKINDFIHNYSRPQENANRTDVKWASATNEKGEGLLFQDDGGTLLNISAWPYTLEALENAKHMKDLRHGNTITLNIDYKQMGVGGDFESSANDNERYMLLKNTEYKYSYKISKIY